MLEKETKIKSMYSKLDREELIPGLILKSEYDTQVYVVLSVSQQRTSLSSEYTKVLLLSNLNHTIKSYFWEHNCLHYMFS